MMLRAGNEGFSPRRMGSGERGEGISASGRYKIQTYSTEAPLPSVEARAPTVAKSERMNGRTWYVALVVPPKRSRVVEDMPVLYQTLRSRGISPSLPMSVW